MPIRRLHDLAGTCVFSKQSSGPILCDPRRLPMYMVHLPRAPLLPKLRGQFAEFLDHESLERLRLLASPTCVGLRYGRGVHIARGAFLGRYYGPLTGAEAPFGIGSRPDRADLPARIDGLPPCIGHSTSRRTCHPCVPPRAHARTPRYGNIRPFPIGYASRPRLRSRLTLS